MNSHFGDKNLEECRSVKECSYLANLSSHYLRTLNNLFGLETVFSSYFSKAMSPV